MVVNLLSNAVKFTPAGGQIRIDARLASPSEPRCRSSRDINSSVHGHGPAGDPTTTSGENHDGQPDDHVTGGATASTYNRQASPANKKRLSFTKALRAFADSSIARASFSSNGSRSNNSSKRPSFSTVHNSTGFNMDNNFNNGLVVDLDGSNGLLATLGETDPTAARAQKALHWGCRTIELCFPCVNRLSFEQRTLPRVRPNPVLLVP